MNIPNPAKEVKKYIPMHLPRWCPSAKTHQNVIEKTNSANNIRNGMTCFMQGW